jgi:hypothetical protein
MQAAHHQFTGKDATVAMAILVYTPKPSIGAALALAESTHGQR